LSAPDAPLFSVVIPVHDGAAFLDGCLASVMAQTERSFEVIVVDDGSQDASPALAERWAARHPGRFSRADPGAYAPHGIVHAYLTGVERARGRYLAFLEQDDRWSERYLESKVRVLGEDARGGIGVVFSPYRVVGDGVYGWDMVARQWLLSRRLPLDRPFDNSRALLRFNNVVSFSAFVCRRELWDTLPLPHDRSTPYFDWWLLAHMSMRSLFFYDTGSTVFWRCSPCSTLGRQSYRRHREQLDAFLRELYASLEHESNRADQATRQAFLHCQRVLPAQLAFLRHVRPATFVAALRLDPDWAVRMLASVVVNRLKKHSS
jgi:glycosyltransferase involved in cell wall biosynthesis